MCTRPNLAVSLVIFVVIILVMLPDMLRGTTSMPEEQNFPAQETAAALQESEEDSVFLFAVDNLNIRSGPGLEHAILKVIPVGEKVMINDTEGDWVSVTYREITGYSHADYLSEHLEDRAYQNIEVTSLDTDGIKSINGIILVNKNSPLPDNYNPGENAEAKGKLEEMLTAAKSEVGKVLVAFSGFRSYEYQDRLYQSDLYNYGEEYTRNYTAKPGYSEHQTGLAFDIGSDSRYWADPSFDDTEEARWLSDNAHKFGFILRYPEGKEEITGYGYESWHFRYVGLEHAKVIFESGLTLEEYLLVD